MTSQVLQQIVVLIPPTVLSKRENGNVAEQQLTSQAELCYKK